MVVGVDEAGKGPVLGSMFAAAVALPDPSALPDDVGDSKRLTAERRDVLDARIRSLPGATVAVAEVPVERIDDPATDMNTLTLEAHSEALKALSCADHRIVVDAADVNEDRFARRLRSRLDGHEIIAEHGADVRHTIVGAASIVAKVARDAHVEALAERFGSIGSGYPSDPVTRAFLADHVETCGELPACARRSWQTSQDLLAAAEQAAIDEF